MAKQQSPLNDFLKQYDRIAALCVLLGLLVSLYYLVSSGLQQRNDEAQFANVLENRSPKDTQATKVDITDYEKILTEAEHPTRTARTLGDPVRPEHADLFTPASKILCVKCRKPVFIDLNICTTAGCGAIVKEEEIDYSQGDSDNDGMSNEFENKYGFDPNNPDDAKLDSDADGFTNLEESEAGTNPKDKFDHPYYATRMTLGDIVSKTIPLAFTDLRPAGFADKERSVIKYSAGFIVTSDDENVKPRKIYAVESAPISDIQSVYDPQKGAYQNKVLHETGFIVKKIIKNKDQQIAVVADDDGIRLATEGDARSTNRFVSDVSVVIENIASKKTATLRMRDERNPVRFKTPVLEPEATITSPDYKSGKPFSVVEGSTFSIKDENYRVKKVDNEDEIVLLQIQKVKNGEKDEKWTSFQLK